MRPNLIIIGAVVVLGGISLIAQGYGGLITTALGIFDLGMAFAIPKPRKVTFQPEGSTRPKLTVDRGVAGASVFYLSFFDDKLIMKRLAGARTTILLGISIAIIGAILESNILIGAAGGGLTGYVLQELAVHTKRERIIKRKKLESAELGDLEIPYTKIDRLLVPGNRLIVMASDRKFSVNLPRGYSDNLSAALAKLLPNVYEEGPIRTGPGPERKE